MATRRDYTNPADIGDMVGKTFTQVLGKKGDDTLSFSGDDGAFTFWHDSDCCETVDIEDICGDLEDLVGSPLLMAEEVQGEDPRPDDADYESRTWTFYKFATAKGYVTVRWLGESNGYYSEDVTLSFIPA